MIPSQFRASTPSEKQSQIPIVESCPLIETLRVLLYSFGAWNWREDQRGVGLQQIEVQEGEIGVRSFHLPLEGGRANLEGEGLRSFQKFLLLEDLRVCHVDLYSLIDIHLIQDSGLHDDRLNVLDSVFEDVLHLGDTLK